MSVFGPVIRTRQPQAPFLASAIDAHGRGPTLDLNFINGAPLDSRIVFTRASSGTSFDVTGVRQTATNNVARLAFDPTTHLPLGLLIEEARTNSLLNSAAPVTQTTASLAIGTYCLWVEGTGSATSSAGTAVGSGFGAATAGSPNVFTTTGAGTVVVTVSGGTPTLFQLENGPFQTAYIATTAAIATRAKDLAIMPLGSWFSPSAAGTFVVEGRFDYGPVNPNLGYLGQISDNTASNLVQMRRVVTSNNMAATATVAGVGKLNVASVGVTTPGAVVKEGVSWGPAGALTAVNGVSGVGVVNAISLAGLVTTLNIGNNNGSNLQTNGYIRRVRYWPRMLSQGELNQVTL